MKVRLGDVVDKIVGNEDRLTTNLKYYVAGEQFTPGRLRISSKGILKSAKGNTLGYQFHYPFQPKDVLFMTKGIELKKCAQVDYEGICSIATFVIRSKDEKIILQEFLPLVMQTETFWQFLEDHKSGSVNYFITWATLANYEFDLPSIEEQHKLSEVVFAMEDLRTKYENLIAQTDELVKSQFIEMFEKNNNSWAILTLDKCCESITGGNTPSMNHPEYYGGDIPFLKSGDIKERSVSRGALWLTNLAIEKTTAKLLPAKTVIVVIRSAALRHEFHAAVTEVPVVINQDLKAFQPKDDFLPEYLMWAIISHESLLLSNVQTVLTSHIEMKDLLNIPVAIAPMKKQVEFCQFIYQADKSKFAAKQALDDLNAAQKALMRQYLG